MGEYVADQLKLPFLEADQFHPPANVAKMSQGIPLQDSDRWDWLRALRTAAEDAAHKPGFKGIVVTCSALKHSYRKLLSETDGTPVVFLFLKASRETLMQRMGLRQGHFMKGSMVESQLRDLEEPTENEADGVESKVVSVEGDLEESRALAVSMAKQILSEHS